MYLCLNFAAYIFRECMVKYNGTMLCTFCILLILNHGCGVFLLLIAVQKFSITGQEAELRRELISSFGKLMVSYRPLGYIADEQFFSRKRIQPANSRVPSFINTCL